MLRRPRIEPPPLKKKKKKERKEGRKEGRNGGGRKEGKERKSEKESRLLAQESSKACMGPAQRSALRTPKRCPN